MIITETIKRECCDPAKDLKPLMSSEKVLFCAHCGRRFIKSRQPDAAGGSENCLSPEIFIYSQYLKYHELKYHEEEME